MNILKDKLWKEFSRENNNFKNENYLCTYNIWGRDRINLNIITYFIIYFSFSPKIFNNFQMNCKLIKLFK